mmetsp:Transcript_30426/g.77645  ORF Transcript_30426/g.77645 Transcript_30426/m.77645 type:complete len:218 (-) Transcript_30426:571-1224(-)
MLQGPPLPPQSHAPAAWLAAAVQPAARAEAAACPAFAIGCAPPHAAGAAQLVRQARPAAAAAAGHPQPPPAGLGVGAWAAAVQPLVATPGALLRARACGPSRPTPRSPRHPTAPPPHAPCAPPPAAAPSPAAAASAAPALRPSPSLPPAAARFHAPTPSARSPLRQRPRLPRQAQRQLLLLLRAGLRRARPRASAVRAAQAPAPRSACAPRRSLRPA